MIAHPWSRITHAWYIHHIMPLGAPAARSPSCACSCKATHAPNEKRPHYQGSIAHDVHTHPYGTRTFQCTRTCTQACVRRVQQGHTSAQRPTPRAWQRRRAGHLVSFPLGFDSHFGFLETDYSAGASQVCRRSLPKLTRVVLFQNFPCQFHRPGSGRESAPA